MDNTAVLPRTFAQAINKNIQFQWIEVHVVAQYFSPKEVAQAIGVSESSLKRWVDKGLIQATKTAGGHRRLELADVLLYLRSTGRGLENPVAVSLPEGCGSEPQLTVESSSKRFSEAIGGGSEADATRTLIDAYLAGSTAAEVVDLVITPAFQEMGHLWECGQTEVYEERRGCEVCLRAVHELRRAIGGGTSDGPVAMGGTLDGDPYTLATTFAELVLRSCGWNATSLGNMLPFDAVRKAIIDNRPALFWVSVTSIRDIDRFTTDFNLLFDIAQSMGTSLVAGGQALTAEVRQRIRYTNFSDNFRHLETFAQTIKSSLPQPADTPPAAPMSADPLNN